MNRRSFIQTAFGSALAVMGLHRLGLGESESLEVKDLILWAPFEAFLPEDQTHNIQSPDDGTQTGILKAEDILKGQALTCQFWHAHGGIYHMFTVTPEHLNTLKSGSPVIIYIPTTVVEDHYHMVIIDPKRVA